MKTGERNEKYRKMRWGRLHSNKAAKERSSMGFKSKRKFLAARVEAGRGLILERWAKK